MARRLHVVVLSLFIAIASIALVADPAGAHGRRRHAKPKPLWACQVAPTIRGIECSEIDRAVAEAAAEFQIDEERFRRLVTCESTFDPHAGRKYRGLTQQSPGYWPKRVRDFNANVAVPIEGNILHPFDNARMAARQIGLGQARWQFPACSKKAGFR